MRKVLGAAHRYVGLLIAGFLFMSGLTGAVISWDAEIDTLLNRDLIMARSDGPAIPSLELARMVEARYPQVQATEIPLEPDAPGYAIGIGVTPRVDPQTGRLYEPGFNAVYLDPATGEETGKRNWGAVWPLGRDNIVSFLYVLHYSLHIPEFWGIERWGLWLMGTIALLWTVDCLVGFTLTLPPRAQRRAMPAGAGTTATPPPRSFWSRWAPAWKIRWRGGWPKLNFDLHRAFSLWTWAILFVVSFTAFSLNLYEEVFYPAMSKVSKVTPSPYDLREPVSKHRPIRPALSFEEAIARTDVEARRRGWEGTAGEAYYSPEYGIYGVSYHKEGEPHDGAGGAGHPTLYIDGSDGRVLGDYRPWEGTAADLFVQAQFPLHSGRILGIPGRILMSVMGLVVATLSVTGVAIWWRKSRARRAAATAKTRRSAEPAPRGTTIAMPGE